MSTIVLTMRISTAPDLSPAVVLVSLRKAFSDLANGTAVQPPSLSVDLPGGGDVITYSAALGTAAAFGVKVSPYIPRDEGKGVVTAWTLVLDTATGEPRGLINAHALTAMRTGATTALAADALLGGDARAATIVGAGPVALQHARHLLVLRPDLAVTVVSRSGRVDPGWEELKNVQHTGNLPTSLPGRDLVALCTSAAGSVIDPRELAPGTLVTSVSTNATGAREIPVEAIPGLDIYVDARSSLDVAAELIMARALGWDPNVVRGDLAELVTNRALSRRTDTITYFRSVGLGLEDVAVAVAALDASQQNENEEIAR